MSIPKDIPVQVEKMFEHYLYRVKLRKSNMHPVQYSEMKRTFYGAISTVMVIVRTAELTEEELENIITAWEEDTMKFWSEQSNN